MKVPRSGLLPNIEVGLCYLRKWLRGESLLFILKQAQSMQASVYSPSSTGQNSTVKWKLHRKGCFPSFNFLPRYFVIYIIFQRSNKLLKFLQSTTYLFHYILFILTLGICTDTQVASSHISCILASFAIFCNVTYTFPNYFSPHATSN